MDGPPNKRPRVALPTSNIGNTLMFPDELAGLSDLTHNGGHPTSQPNNMPNPAGVPVGMQANFNFNVNQTFNQQANVEQDKRKLIQQQLVLLLHAHKCQRQEQMNGEIRQCQLPHCKTMKSVLSHMTTCSAGKDCPVSLCASSRQIIAHWKKCSRGDCPVCLPLKSASTRSRNGQVPNMNTSVSGPPVPSQPLNPSQAEMEKAYHALGLRVPTTSTDNNQIVNQSMMPQQQQLQLQPASIQPLNQGLPQNLAQIGSPPLMPQSYPNQRMPTNINMAPNITIPSSISQNFNVAARPVLGQQQRTVKEWHKSVTQDLRNYLVHKLVQAIFPTPDPQALRDHRMQNLVQYARKVENDMFEQANSRDEYYHLLAEKICKIQKELEEKRHRRQQQQQVIGAAGVVPVNPGPRLPIIPGASRMPTATTTAFGTDMPPHQNYMGKPNQTQQLHLLLSSPDPPPDTLPSSAAMGPSIQSLATGFLNNSISATSISQPIIKTEIKQEPVSGKNELSMLLDSHESDVVFKEEEHTDIKTEKPSTSTEATTSASSDQSEASAPTERRRNPKKVWSRDELRQALMPVLQKLYSQEPESLPFRQPVDPTALGIPDYHDIIKKPMDLSTIHKRLDSGLYKDPWDFLDDVWLMLDNAWLYNKKNSRVYKFCTKLSEVFEAEIDGVMQNMGFCCGRKYVFNPQVLCCFGKQLCTIPRDAVYYSYDKRYFYCEKCFKDIKGDEVELSEGPLQPPVRIKKEEFIREKNDHIDYEPFVHCQDCGRKQHQICVLHMDQIWPSGYVCKACLDVRGEKRSENRYGSKKLPTTRLGTYLEKRVNSFLKKKDSGSGRVNIRVLASSDQICEVKPGMKSKFVDTGEMQETFPFRSKAIFAFEDMDGEDMCFFGMYVQEYGSESAHPNTRRVYVAYLDSVHFFQPREFKTAVYHELLIGYLDYVKTLGYTMAHIWACPPSEGDDYIFHCHPPEQKIPKPKRLQEWYKKMLDKAIIERVVIDYKDILKDTIENGITSCANLPYFEGDFWPGVLEDTIKQMEQEEEEERRKRLEMEAASALDIEDPLNEDSNDGTDGIGKKKGQKNAQKKKAKSKNYPRKAASKAGAPCGGNDLFQKLYLTLEKHKEVFFVIRLHSVQSAQTLGPVQDPDPLINSDLMESRDSFLALARDKHLEFSSLRRTKYSTMALLYELHNQGKDSYTFTCNNCSEEVETRYHCTVCEDYDLCSNCYEKLKHEHKMNKLGPQDFADDSSGQDKPQDPQAVRKQSIQQCINSLLHACQCRDANCHLPRCQRIQRIIAHTRSCKKKTNGNCPTCKQLIIWCCYHAKYCQEAKCPVPFCLSLKNRLRQQHLQARMQQNQLLRRRMAMMNQSSYNSGGGGNSSSTNADNHSSLSSQAPLSVPAPPYSQQQGGKLIPNAPIAAMSAAQEAQMAAQRQAYISQPQNPLRPAPVTQMVPTQPSVMHPSQSMPIMHQQQPQHQMQLPHQPSANNLQAMTPAPNNIGTGLAQPTISNSMEAMVRSTIAGLQGQSPAQQKTNPPTQQAITQLMHTLKSPATPQQQQQLLNILKSNPQLMVAFTKQRQQKAGQQQQQPQPQQQISNQGWGGVGMRHPPQMYPSMQQPPLQQQLQQSQLPQQRTPNPAAGQFQQAPPYQEQQVMRPPFQANQYQQQMLRMMSTPQQGMNNTRPQLPPPGTPSPRVSNPSPHSQTVSQHFMPSMPGPSHSGLPNNTDQVMFPSNHDNAMCNNMPLPQPPQNGNVQTMTPQDQLSRFVDNL